MAEHGLRPLGQQVFVGKTYTQKITRINLLVRARLVQELCLVRGTVLAFGSVHKKETSALNRVPYEVPSGPNTTGTFGLLSQTVHAFSRSHFRTEGNMSPGRGRLPVLCRCCLWLKGVTGTRSCNSWQPTTDGQGRTGQPDPPAPRSITEVRTSFHGMLAALSKVSSARSCPFLPGSRGCPRANTQQANVHSESSQDPPGAQQIQEHGRSAIGPLGLDHALPASREDPITQPLAHSSSEMAKTFSE